MWKTQILLLDEKALVIPTTYATNIQKRHEYFLKICYIIDFWQKKPSDIIIVGNSHEK